MFLPPVHRHLAKLKCTNEKLLFMYSQLPVFSNAEMSREVASRVQIRNKIKLELEQLVETVLSKKEKKAYIVFLSILLFITKKEQVLISIFRRPGAIQVRTLEYRNLKAYYKLLFLQPLAPEVTNLLLAQKRELEKREFLPYY